MATKNEVETYIKAKIIACNKCYHAVEHSLLNKIYITHSLRVCLYKTTVIPIVACDTESCTLTYKKERALMTWERKILRKICGLMGE